MFLDQIVFKSTAPLIANVLLDSQSYQIAPFHDRSAWFKWKNGILAPVYCDSRRMNGANQNSGSIRATVSAMAQMVSVTFPSANLVVGLADGGIVWSSTLARELNLDHAWVRKEVKSHGIGNLVAGAPSRGATAIVVDDLVASGKTIQDGINTLNEEFGIKCIGVASIVNWGFADTALRFNDAGITARALTSWPYLVDAALERCLIEESAAAELRRFYLNPQQHQWTDGVIN